MPVSATCWHAHLSHAWCRMYLCALPPSPGCCCLPMPQPWARPPWDPRSWRPSWPNAHGGTPQTRARPRCAGRRSKRRWVRACVCMSCVRVTCWGGAALQGGVQAPGPSARLHTTYLPLRAKCSSTCGHRTHAARAIDDQPSQTGRTGLLLDAVFCRVGRYVEVPTERRLVRQPSCRLALAVPTCRACMRAALWPELALVNHSCAANTAWSIVGDLCVGVVSGSGAACTTTQRMHACERGAALWVGRAPGLATAVAARSAACPSRA